MRLVVNGTLSSMPCNTGAARLSVTSALQLPAKLRSIMGDICDTGCPNVFKSGFWAAVCNAFSSSLGNILEAVSRGKFSCSDFAATGVIRLPPFTKMLALKQLPDGSIDTSAVRLEVTDILALLGRAIPQLKVAAMALDAAGVDAALQLSHLVTMPTGIQAGMELSVHVLDAAESDICGIWDNFLQRPVLQLLGKELTVLEVLQVLPFLKDWDGACPLQRVLSQLSSRSRAALIREELNLVQVLRTIVQAVSRRGQQVVGNATIPRELGRIVNPNKLPRWLSYNSLAGEPLFTVGKMTSQCDPVARLAKLSLQVPSGTAVTPDIIKAGLGVWLANATGVGDAAFASFQFNDVQVTAASTSARALAAGDTTVEVACAVSSGSALNSGGVNAALLQAVDDKTLQVPLCYNTADLVQQGGIASLPGCSVYAQPDGAASADTTCEPAADGSGCSDPKGAMLQAQASLEADDPDGSKEWIFYVAVSAAGTLLISLCIYLLIRKISKRRSSPRRGRPGRRAPQASGNHSVINPISDSARPGTGARVQEMVARYERA